MTISTNYDASCLETIQQSATLRLRDHALRELVSRVELVTDIRRGLEEARGGDFGKTLAAIAQTERRAMEAVAHLAPGGREAMTQLLDYGFSFLRLKAQQVHDVLSSERKELRLARCWEVSVDDIREIIPGVVSIHTVVDGIASYFEGKTSAGAHCRGTAHNIIRHRDDRDSMEITMNHEDVHNIWECFLPKSHRIDPETIARIRHAGVQAQARFLFDTLHEEMVAQLDFRMEGGFKKNLQRRDIAKSYSTAGRNFVRYLDALDEFGDKEQKVAETALRLFNDTNSVLERSNAACVRIGGEAPLFLWGACVTFKPSQYRHIPALIRHRFGEEGRLAVLRSDLVA